MLGGVTFRGGRGRQGAGVIPPSPVVAPLLPSFVHDSDAPKPPAHPVFMQPYTRHTSRFLISFITFLPFALWSEFYWCVPFFGRNILYTVVLGCGNAKSSHITIRCAWLQADHPRHGCFHIFARWWADLRHPLTCNAPKLHTVGCPFPNVHNPLPMQEWKTSASRLRSRFGCCPSRP